MRQIYLAEVTVRIVLIGLRGEHRRPLPFPLPGSRNGVSVRGGGYLRRLGLHENGQGAAETWARKGA